MQRVHNELADRGAWEGEPPRANFISVLCLAWPDGTTELFEGKVYGHLVWPPRGSNGFGYDPIFVADGHKLTFGEMEPADKYAISHRTRAFDVFRRHASMAPAADAFGVYIHWPFCAQKCPYCDFNSHVRFGGIDEARFLAAYLAELDRTRALLGPRAAQSIFFGGGTPSLMAPATVAAILDRIGELWSIAPDAEITLEANPGSVEAERFRGYAKAGVTRVSLGVQSLDDAVLKSLGRIHSVAEAKAAIEIAHDNFDRVSFDLIYARPGQTVAAWRAELNEALALAAGHLSLYQLTIEPETPFAALHAAGKLVPPDADAALALYDVTQELTGAAGLPAYEISNHAVPGEESRHNLLYWRYGEYAGCGPGAHGRLVLDGVRHATSAERVPERWLERVEREGSGLIEMLPLARAPRKPTRCS